MRTLRLRSQLSTYKYRSSGEKAMPLGAARSLVRSVHLTVLHHVDPAERQLLPRIVEGLRKAEGRIGEVEDAIRAIDQIIRAVETLPVVPFGEDRDLPGPFQSGHAAGCRVR